MTVPPDQSAATLLTPVLGALEFPARRWELVTAAEIYGADAMLRDRLRRLPDQLYRDVLDVARALALPAAQPRRPLPDVPEVPA